MPPERRNRGKNTQSNYTLSPDEVERGLEPFKVSGSPNATKCRPSRACLGCRQIKMKCVRRDDGDDSCIRCKNAGRECIVMTKQVGRRPGSKNKYTDINKLLRRIENETQTTNKSKVQSSEVGSQLASILAEALRVYQEKAEGSDRNGAKKLLEKLVPLEAESHSPNEFQTQDSAQDQSSLTFQPPMLAYSFSIPGDDTCSINFSQQSKTDESAVCEQSVSSPRNSSVKNFSNPLELLSQATDVLRRRDDGSNSSNTGIPELDCESNMHDRLHLNSGFENIVLDDSDMNFLHNTLSINISRDDVKSGIKYLTSVDPPREPHSIQYDLLPSGLEYFGNSSSTSRFDVNDKDLDPIHLSLITEEEVQGLFDYFYAEPVNLCFCLDPEYFTPAFVRSDSLFLLTAICFCASQFAPNSNKALAKRLEIHFHRSAELVIARGYRSVSIVSAFCIGSGWTTPAQKISQEKSWMYLSHASALALELGINACFTTPASSFDSAAIQPLRGREFATIQDELEYHGVSPHTDLARRILRSKQRTWLHLYLWGSGLALTLKRPWIIRSNEVPISPLWHKDRLSVIGDNALVSLVMLRRTTEYILKEMAEISGTSIGPDYQMFRDIIDSKLDSWHQEWLGSTSSSEYSIFPVYLPYPALLFKHGKLLLVGAAIKHCYGGNDIPNDVVLDGLKVALSVCKLIVDELSTGRQLKFFPNNVALMSLYAAVCALQLLSMAHINNSQKMHIFGLLGQEAYLLEKTGSIRKCSFGMPTLYGRHLKALLNSAANQMIPLSKQRINERSIHHNDWIYEYDEIPGMLFDSRNSLTSPTTENTSTELATLENNTSMIQPLSLDGIKSVNMLDVSSALLEDSVHMRNSVHDKGASTPSGALQLGAGSNTLFGFGFAGDIFDPMDLGTGDDFFHMKDFLHN